jgi:peptidoglycan/LPS O-acetylase OafA/YrhL
VLVALAATLAIAAALHAGFEQPVKRWLRRTDPAA